MLKSIKNDFMVVQQEFIKLHAHIVNVTLIHILKKTLRLAV